MDTQTRYARRVKWLAVVTLGLLVALLLVASPAGVAQADKGPNPGVLPPQSHPHGKTYGEWSAAWWQWAFQSPVHNPPYTGAIYNPLFVNGPADCALGQTGRVWFIGGVMGISGAATRTCSIPTGTALFFPVLNVVWDNVGTVPPLDEAGLREVAALLVGNPTDLYATIDGVPVTNLRDYRIFSPVFKYQLPAEDNFYQHLGVAVPGDAWPSTTVEPAVADGYWLFLNPLPPGVHTLTFGGSSGPPGNFSTEVTYVITVTPGR